MKSPKSFDADCIVVGSGPAGVSVSFPLLEAGVRVLMIDGASRDQSVEGANEGWQRMLGAQLEALLPEDGLSPKLRTPRARRIVGDFNQVSDIHGDSFIPITGRARGGLSQIWGGFVCEFDAQDIGEWPISISDLRPSYQAVVDRIGVSGSDVDEMAEFFGRSGMILPPLPVSPSAARLLKSYRPGSQGSEFGLGIARNAILTIDRDHRFACDLRKDCLWGCARGSIYDARFDLSVLERLGSFQLVDDAFVAGLARINGGWEVFTREGRRMSAPRVIIAAGTLGTAALIIPLLVNVPSELRLLNSPVLAMPLLVPSRLGKAESSAGYSLAQLGYRLRYGDKADDYIAGAIYAIDGLPASSFASRLPLSRRAGSVLVDAFSPALLVATGYFPGSCSDNKLRWERKGNQLSMVIRGGNNPDLAGKLAAVTRRLRKIWWQLGALLLPGVALATPGTDVHYAGLFGMGRRMAFGSTEWGELNGAPGVYVVDGSILPTLPSKYLTLTIMANADRIGRHIADVLRN